MDIARQKRDENIAEYILYIWQLEDLLRALKFDPRAVFATLVAPRDATDEWKLSALEWYMDIAGLLEREGKSEVGHLDHTLHLVGEMNDLHLTLMEQPAGRRYRELFALLASSLPALRATLGRDDVGDIELAFRSLYAAMLYRLKGAAAETPGSPDIASGLTSDGGTANNSSELPAAVGRDAVRKGGVADDVLELVSPVIAALADMYHKVERGEVDLYRHE